MKKVIGVGAGGHAKVILDILRLEKEYDLIGLTDQNKKLWQTELMGIPVLGDDDMLVKLYKNQGVRHAFIGVGAAANPDLRKRLYEMLSGRGFKLVPAIHRRAIIALSSKIGQGPSIMAAAVINPDAVLGNNVIINTGAIIEHDCVIGSHTQVATGARLAGAVQIQGKAFIGMGASVRESVKIGRGAIIGAGAVVIQDVPDAAVVVGAPARIVKNLNKER